MKKFLGIVLEVLLVIFVMAFALIVFLTINEYNPQENESVTVTGTSAQAVKTNKELSILSWNIGYSALGKDQDFVMDGGGTVPPANQQQVAEHFEGIQNLIKSQKADFNFIQEIDLCSSRSFYIDMTQYLSKKNSSFAYNYNCRFVPFPLPPLAKIMSGIFTTTDYKIESAFRKSVPCPFSWPLSTANLKRCLLISYLPVEGSTKKLVLINLHLEAYSDDEARIVQLGILNNVIEEEYAKGNYVIAGGDFNQTFPGTAIMYPNTHTDDWAPNEIQKNSINSKFSMCFDSSTPTCRLLNQPYNPTDTEGTQYFVIDGFIVTPNVKVKSVKTISQNFKDSDHNPVKMVFELVK